LKSASKERKGGFLRNRARQVRHGASRPKKSKVRKRIDDEGFDGSSRQLIH